MVFVYMAMLLHQSLGKDPGGTMVLLGHFHGKPNISWARLAELRLDIGWVQVLTKLDENFLLSTPISLVQEI